MKSFVLAAIFLTFIGRVSGQATANENVDYPQDDETLYQMVNTDVCSCLNEFQDEFMKHFRECSKKAMDQNKEKIFAFLSASASAKSAKSGQAMGRLLAERLAIRLIDSCNAFYEGLNVMIESALPYKNADSVAAQLQTVNMMINAGDTSGTTYLYKGFLLYRQQNFSAAAQAFRHAAILDDNPIIRYYARVSDRKKLEQSVR